MTESLSQTNLNSSMTSADQLYLERFGSSTLFLLSQASSSADLGLSLSLQKQKSSLTRLIPETARLVTPAFLTTAFRRAGRLPKNRTITAIDCHRIGEGMGLLSEIMRIKVTQFEGPDDGTTDIPSSFILKSSVPVPNVELSDLDHFNEQEMLFYESWEKEMPPELLGPEVFLVKRDHDRSVFVCLMEDLGLSEFKPGDQVKGVTAFDAGCLCQSLAALHAKHWNSAEFEQPDGLFKDILTPLSKSWEFITKLMVDNQDGKWLDNPLLGFTPEQRTTYHHIIKKVAQNYDKINRYLTGAPSTFIHWDPRADNLFFKPPTSEEQRMLNKTTTLSWATTSTTDQEKDSSSTSSLDSDFVSRLTNTRVLLIDYQLVMRQKAAHDVAYILCSSVDPDERRKFEKLLLRNYYDLLVQQGLKYKKDIASEFSFEQFMFDYQIAAMGILNHAVFTKQAIPDVEVSSDGQAVPDIPFECLSRAAQLGIATNRRIFAAVAEMDLDLLDKI